MSVYVTNLVINSGETFSQSLDLLNSSNGSLDITGYAVTSMIRKHPDSKTKTAEFNIQTIDPQKGLINLSLGSSITSNIDEGRYVYDVLVTDDLNKKSIVMEGMILVRAGIST